MKFDTVVANPPFSLDKWGAEEAAHDQFNRFGEEYRLKVELGLH